MVAICSQFHQQLEETERWDLWTGVIKSLLSQTLSMRFSLMSSDEIHKILTEICLDSWHWLFLSLSSVTVASRQYFYLQKRPTAILYHCCCHRNGLFSGSVLWSLKWGGRGSCGTPRTLLSLKPQSGRLPPLFRGAQHPVWHIVKRLFEISEMPRERKKEV